MAVFTIHRMKETPRLSFRWAAHTGGAARVRLKDYDKGGTVEAASHYGAWSALQGSEKALRVGDLLEDPAGALRIYKYVGFEEACWAAPEVAPAVEPVIII
jgi:hypothetical protein